MRLILQNGGHCFGNFLFTGEIFEVIDAFVETHRTILHEELHQKPEVIEHQLAHKVPDANGTAYNRTKFLKERKVMMQLWADYLDKLKKGAKVIPLRGNTAA